MSNTTPVERRQWMALCVGAAAGLTLTSGCATAQRAQVFPGMPETPASNTLSTTQRSIVPISAFAAVGDIPKLNLSLNHGLDSGMSISDAREVLVQLYAYAGFPRSLNALTELMKVVDSRKKRGVQDAPGRAPVRPIPQGDALLAAGTANQTRLSGAVVQGPLFDFAPIANEYLRTHLFGDIFERDNLDWHSREVATVSMLSAIVGVESQLQAHMRISMNIGLTASQLRQIEQVLAERVDTDSARRAHEALDRHLASVKA